MHSQCLLVLDTSKMWGPQSQKLLLLNKNHLFISALPPNCSPITIVKSMDHTCLGRNGSISTCFPECAKHRWRDLCRPNATNLLCRWHQQFLLQFPSHGQLQGLLGPNTWEMWMGVWHRSKNVILNFATYGCCAKLEISFKQRRHVLTSVRFCPSLQQTVWNTIELRHMTWLRSLCQNRLK